MSGPRLPEAYRLLGYDALGSTNDEAARLAEAGALPWTLVWARCQTAGRGRRGRRWLSPPGNLYASLVLRPVTSVGNAAQLGLLAALAIGDALAALLRPIPDLRYKWPNDVLVEGCKVAGILLESAATGARSLDWVVVGVGINVASHPAGTRYPATSLAALAATPPSIESVLEEFAAAFLSWETRWRCEGFAPVRRAWLDRAQGLGAMIEVRLDRESVTGRFVDLDGDGALLLETHAGRRRIAAGEVLAAAA